MCIRDRFIILQVACFMVKITLISCSLLLYKDSSPGRVLSYHTYARGMTFNWILFFFYSANDLLLEWTPKILFFFFADPQLEYKRIMEEIDRERSSLFSNDRTQSVYRRLVNPQWKPRYHPYIRKCNILKQRNNQV
eukprot:TRINITY_DN7616_c0_g1_i2.p1 TRINITY_DN7616_c0_g1~~TRINITY_DN7616_c0_g1_i2.p1  ORF type:complete len:136 (+),score=5.66 TRINITY_DN7616_c0_g1_i2:98-505(+)